MLKVSVIVATYCPGDGLHRVIESLDEQTLSQGEFETIFVDDGSPDDTLERLRVLAESRPQMRITGIAHSGWPSRPRNVGLDMARGEYVTFMDHDDQLYPGALADAYQVAHGHRAEVVNTKETQTKGWFWGWGHFQEDLYPNRNKNPGLLMPMRPHKLYLREFLRRHDIRFHEGQRVIYEDIFFNLDVYAKAERIAVLASRPFYKWVSTGEHISASYGDDAGEAWQAFERIFDFLGSGQLDEAGAEFLLLHTYQLRVLTMMLGPLSLGRSDDANAETLRIAPEFVERHVPVQFDERLSSLNRARAHLLRSGQTHLLRLLAEADQGISAVSRTSDVSWNNSGELVVSCEATWVDATGAPLLFRSDEGRILRLLPPELSSCLPDEVLDVTRDVEDASSNLSLRSRRERLGWPVETSSHSVVNDAGEGLVTVSVRATGRLSIHAGAFDRPLEDDVWSLALRSDFMGYSAHRAVRHDASTRSALLQGRVAIAYATPKGVLALDVGQTSRRLFDETSPDLAGIRIRRHGLRQSKLAIPFAGGVAVKGETRIPVSLLLQPDPRGSTIRFTAEIVGDESGVRLESLVTAPRGTYRIRVTDILAKREWATRLFATVGRTGRLTVGRRNAPRDKHVWDLRS